jgi:outer membrane protein assembly factor BamB
MRLLRNFSIFLILTLGFMFPGLTAVQNSVSLAEFCRVDLGFSIESSPAGGNWPMFRQNDKRTGIATSLPEVVYVGSDNLNLHAIATENCREAWSFPVGGAVRSSPAVEVDAIGQDLAIYFGSDDANLYAVSPEGQHLWQYAPNINLDSNGDLRAPGVIRSSPMLFLNENYFLSFDPDNPPNVSQFQLTPDFPLGNSLIIGSDDGHFYGVQTGGRELIRVPSLQSGVEVFHGAYRNTPVFYEDAREKFLIAGSLERVLFAARTQGVIFDSQGSFDQSFVDKGWEVFLDGPVAAYTALGENGAVYAATDIGTLYSVRAADGVEQWRVRLNGDIHGSPAIGRLGTIFLGTDAGIMHAIRPNGTPLCSFRVLGPDGRANTGDEALFGIRSSAAITPNGLVIFGANDGYLYIIDEDTCQLRASFKTNGPIVSSPLVAIDGNEMRVMFGSGDGKFYILSVN